MTSSRLHTMALAALGVATLGAGPATAALPACGTAATNDWTGAGGNTSWTTGANWDLGVPTTGQHVCLGSGTGSVQYPAATGNPNGVTTTVASIQSSGKGLTLRGSTLNVTGPDPSALQGVTINGGTLSLTAGATIAQLTQSGGTLTGAGPITLTGPGATSAFSGGTWDPAGAPIAVAAGHTLTISGAPALNRALTNGGTLTLADAASVGGAGSITNAPGGTLAKAGPGTTTVSVPVTNAGTMNVPSGTLTTSGLANTGTINLSGGGQLSVGSAFTNGGVISGTGTVTTSTLTNNGTLRPGGTGGYGQLTVGGGLVLGPAGTVEIDVGGTTAGTNLDRVAVTGTATLGGTLAVTTAPAYTPSVQTDHDVITRASTAGASAFSGITGDVGVVGGRYTVVTSPTAATLRFTPPALGLTLSAASLDLGSAAVGASTAPGSMTATVTNTFRAGYQLSATRTAFTSPTDIPLRVVATTGAAGAGPIGVAGTTGVAVPVAATAPAFGQRAGTPATTAGLTSATGDPWTLAFTAGPMPWAQANVPFTSTVTVTAVNP